MFTLFMETCYCGERQWLVGLAWCLTVDDDATEVGCYRTRWWVSETFFYCWYFTPILSGFISKEHDRSFYSSSTMGNPMDAETSTELTDSCRLIERNHTRSSKDIVILQCALK